MRFFAIDTSGSTAGFTEYWQCVDSILSSYQPNDIIIEWGSMWGKIDMNTVSNYVTNKRGNGGGTDAEYVIYGLQANPRDDPYELILITDGEICSSSIDKCDQLIRQNNIKFSYAKVYVINKRNPNISVAAPFIRNCPSEIITPLCEATEEAKATYLHPITQEDLNTLDDLKSISTLDQFYTKHDSILRALTARLLGTVGDKELRNEVCRMQARIIKNKAEKVDTSDLVQALEAGDIDSALQLGSGIVENHAFDSEFESKIQNLIRICDGSLRQTFDAHSIQASRATRADDVVEVDAIDVADVDTSTASTFVCPVSYEDETDPTILIAQPDEPLLVGLEKDDANLLIDSPLNALTVLSTFGSKFAEHVDHPISLKMLRESYEVGHPINVSPLTRKKIVGAIPLGASKEHVAAANWTLSQLVSGGKKLGNLNLWFAVLWHLIKTGKIPYLEEVLPFVEEQMLWRLRNTTTSASLTGLSNYPQARVPLSVACWFSVTSPALSLKVTPNFDTLRLHSLHAMVLLDIVRLIKFPLPDGIETHINRTSVLLQMIRMAKNDFKEFQMLVSALTQKCLLITKEDVGVVYSEKFDKLLIPIDGEPGQNQIEKIYEIVPLFKRLPIIEIVGLASLVKPNTSAGSIDLAFN